MTELVKFEDYSKIATAIFKSKFYGFQNEEQVMTLMLLSHAEGRHPALVARDYHMINGKPSLSATAILMRFQEAGGSIEWLQLTDIIAEAKFKHQQGGELTIAWTIQQAASAGLTSNPVWKKHPRAMLRSRVTSEGVRAIFPACLNGFYSKDEIEEIEFEKEQSKKLMKDITPKQEPIIENEPEIIEPEFVLDDVFLSMADTAALGGTEGYIKWWLTLSPSQRDAMMKPIVDENGEIGISEHEKMKQMAASVDAVAKSQTQESVA